MSSAIKEAALQLPPAERLELAELLMRSLRDVVAADPPLTDDERAELHRRIDAYMTKPSTTSWELFETRLGK